MEVRYANAASLEIRIRFQKRPNQTGVDFAATRKGNMRVPRMKLRFQPSRDSSFLHTFVNLEKVWMTATNPDPEDFRRSFWRESAEANDRQEERAELNCVQPIAKYQIGLLRHIAEEAERKMHLLWFNPAHAADVWIQITQD